MYYLLHDSFMELYISINYADHKQQNKIHGFKELKSLHSPSYHYCISHILSHFFSYFCFIVYICILYLICMNDLKNTELSKKKMLTELDL